MAVQVQLSGARKAAILLLTLGEDPSSEVCKHLREEEVEAIVKELTQLGTVPAETGERVTLLGAQGDERISAFELAAHIGTIPYQLLCLFGLRLPRRFVRSAAP